MKNKINIAELLKDCPSGMELDCTMFNNVTFVRVDNNRIQFPIEIAVGGLRSKYLTKEGCFHDNTLIPEAKCVIFPKGKTTWEGFQIPFKNGDIVATNTGNWVGITTGGKKNAFIPVYCVIKSDGEFEAYFDKKETWGFERLATEEEKAKLFQAIKDNGYKWNAETKTLEKLVEPRFKVGNSIKYKNGKNKDGVKEGIILSITDDTYDVAVTNDMGVFIPIADQDNWELVPNKFDITTLKPFDKVLVKTDVHDPIWSIDFFGMYSLKFSSFTPFMVTSGRFFQQCVPYRGNEHLLGTTNDCDDFYKTWKK